MRIELKNIRKHFGDVKANHDVSFTVASGTIHGILGENGAGKSTLMKILAGHTRRDSGSIKLDGREAPMDGPAEAARRGIGMLYQDPLDFPAMSVLENFMIGASGSKRTNRERLRESAATLGFTLHPEAPLEKLTFGERQQLELLRLLARGVRVLILDEPTTGISERQKDLLFASLRRLADEGKTVLLVSHKMEDIQTLCDSVTVLRAGQVTGEARRPFDPSNLLEMMFGTPPAPPPRCLIEHGDALLEMVNVSATGGRAGLHDCNVTIRAGEVVGLAGLEGSGQSVFLRLAAGLGSPLHGDVRFQGKLLNDANHATFRAMGGVYLPTSRLEEGLIPELTITEHFALASRRDTFLTPWKAALSDASAGIDRFGIAGRPESPARSLSGGNQQRLLLSLMPANPSLLLLENPTRGLDLESAHAVWRHLHAHCRKGAGLVFSSAELDEILMVADRVLVFYDGRIVLDKRLDATTPEEISLAIAGGLEQAAAIGVQAA